MANQDLGNQLSVLTQMKEVLSQLPAMFDKVGTAAGSQQGALNELAESMEEATDTSKIKDMTEAMQELGDETDSSASKFKGFGKKAGILGAAMGGLRAGFGTFTQILGGAF